jgi:hypothetical protein
MDLREARPMPKLCVELTKDDIRTAVAEWIERRYSMTLPSPNEVALVIEVKSKQNYRSEWERADYRGRFES